jgi:hypothetical protein
MNEINNEEYDKELLNLYKKFYRAVTKCIEQLADIKREEAIGLVMEEVFGNEYNSEMSPFKKQLRSNILSFFVKGMTVCQVEKMLLE